VAFSSTNDEEPVSDVLKMHHYCHAVAGISVIQSTAIRLYCGFCRYVQRFSRSMYLSNTHSAELCLFVLKDIVSSEGRGVLWVRKLQWC